MEAKLKCKLKGTKREYAKRNRTIKAGDKAATTSAIATATPTATATAAEPENVTITIQKENRWRKQRPKTNQRQSSIDNIYIICYHNKSIYILFCIIF